MCGCMYVCINENCGEIYLNFPTLYVSNITAVCAHGLSQYFVKCTPSTPLNVEFVPVLCIRCELPDQNENSFTVIIFNMNMGLARRAAC